MCLFENESIEVFCFWETPNPSYPCQLFASVYGKRNKWSQKNLDDGLFFGYDMMCQGVPSSQQQLCLNSSSSWLIMCLCVSSDEFLCGGRAIVCFILHLSCSVARGNTTTRALRPWQVLEPTFLLWGDTIIHSLKAPFLNWEEDETLAFWTQFYNKHPLKDNNEHFLLCSYNLDDLRVCTSIFCRDACMTKASFVHVSFCDPAKSVELDNVL